MAAVAAASGIAAELDARFPDACRRQTTTDGIATFWVDPERAPRVLGFLKNECAPRYELLFDLSAIDERLRRHRDGQPQADFTLFYHLLSLQRLSEGAPDADVRIKTALTNEHTKPHSVVSLWPAANWYEREVWDMFGIEFEGHPNLRRILTPPNWQGHPLRKEHPARATELPAFAMNETFQREQQEALRFVPEDWGMQRSRAHTDYMFLNLGPNHPSVHGVLRVALQLDGEVIVDAVPDIGYHHRAAEKMGERQSWHTYIPYTDRIDYLGGVMNNLPYVMAVERMAGIEVPDRARVIRIMLAELFRISSHLVFFGTFAQDLGQMSPVFYMFADRERLLAIIEAITGGRMHPSWFRIGGVASDLPEGWDGMVREYVDYMGKRLDGYAPLVIDNAIVKRRSIGIGRYDTATALDWSVTGPGLRATGPAWDLRKMRPYGGYEQFQFEVPTATGGDSYARCVVRYEEMRQSLRIIRQCLDNMPAGQVKARHPQATPPPREATMHDIETLIQHFLNVSWGPVIPPAECCVTVEATKGWNGYYLISDGSTTSYRTRIRTPSFAHLQMIPAISRGLMIPDLIAILASIDFVLADVDR